MRQTVAFILLLAAFALGFTAIATAQEIPQSIAPILEWDIESAYQNEAGMGHVVFVKADSSATPVRTDSLHAYYGVSGERTAWEAYVGGTRYVFSKAWGAFVLDAEAEAGIEAYYALLSRYGDRTMNGIPDIIDALEHVQMIKHVVER